MRLFLVQHADAVEKDVDPDRPLSETGAAEAQRVANAVRGALGNAEVWHSGKRRAEQTAAIMCGLFGPKPLQHDGLSPKDDPKVIAKALEGRQADVVLVGHLPHLSRLAAYLLTGNPDDEIVTFRKAGVVALSRDEAGSWSLVWMMVPELAP